MNDIYKYLLEDLRIAITDDHDLVLEGFKSFLEKRTSDMSRHSPPHNSSSTR